MKGSICFVADLMRALKIPFSLEIIQCSSYRGKTRGNLEIFGLDRLKVQGKDVLVVDDIYDSGETMNQVIKALEGKGANSLKSLVLLEKKKGADYALFLVDTVFVIGYGLDHEEQYRGLPSIYVKDL